MSLVLRVRTATDKLDRAANPISLVELSGKSLKPAEKILVRIERDIDALADAIAEALHAPKAINLTDVERNQSAVAAITAWAKDRGAAIARPDSAHRQVVEHTTEEHRPFWLNQNAERVFGLVSHVIAGALEAEGVLAWRTNPDDGHLRIVHTEWLTAHADIFQHVFGDWPGGHRCRFCRMAEIPTSNQLQAVEPEQCKSAVLENGVPLLPRGAVLTHEKCRPHWLRWLELARRYRTLQEAQEADKAAGRESRAPAPMAEPELAEQAALPPGYSERHFNPNEQACT